MDLSSMFRNKLDIILTLGTFACCLMVFIFGFLFWNKKSDEINKNKFEWFDFVFCLFLSIASLSFLPFFAPNSRAPQTDNSVFLYIGEQMHNGLLPYRDLFDHKGIFLYFIEYIGIGLTPNSYWGMFLVELINMVFFILCSYKIIELYTKNRVIIYNTLLISTVSLATNLMLDSNLTEEYALPWIALSFYIFLKFIKTRVYKFTDIILIGIGFSIVALLRVNMVAVWAIFIPTVLVMLIIEKRGKDIAKCILGFLIGLCIICIPTLVYLLYTETLKNMIDCYILFNMQYTSSMGSSLKSVLVAGLYFVVILLPGIISILVSAFYKNKDCTFYCSLLLFVVSFALILISARCYRHYSVIVLPSLLIPLAICNTMLYEKLSSKLKTKILTFNKQTVMVISSLMLIGALFVNFFISPKVVSVSGRNQVVSYIQENSEKDDDVLIIGYTTVFYSLADRSTKNKYFYQFPPITINDEIKNDFMNELKTKPSDLIILQGKKEDAKKENKELNSIIEYLDEQCDYGKYEFKQEGNIFSYKKQ